MVLTMIPDVRTINRCSKDDQGPFAEGGRAKRASWASDIGLAIGAYIERPVERDR
jgi:hypothetical protein